MLTAIGFFLLVVGGLGLVGYVLQKKRAGRVLTTPFAPTGQVASQGRTLATPKGGISTYGKMQTQQLLTSPVSSAPCVYYNVRVEAEWGDKGSEQKHTVIEQHEAVPFAVDDGSGPVVIAIDPQHGGDLCSTKPFARKKFSRGLMATMTSKPLEVTPHFSIPPELKVPGPLGRTIDVPVTASFFVTEEYLEPKGALYVNGKLRDDGAIGAPNWGSLLVQDKTREEVAGAAAKTAKRALIVGLAAAPLGAILAIVGFLTAPAQSAEPTSSEEVALVAPKEGQPAAEPVAASLATSDLDLSGDCDALGFDLEKGMIRVMNASDAINVTAIDGTKLSRVSLRLDGTKPGQSVAVCSVGARCKHLVQLGTGATTFINSGSGVGGRITVNEYDLASGAVDLAFDDVILKDSNGKKQCKINGTLVTSGLTP